MPTYEIGSLVRARGREWVVLPGDDAEVLRIRPLGGTDADACGLVPDLESVTAATFAPPDARDLGDSGSARLLRDAVRLTFRAGAGPFRSFGRIAVEPRSYQLVPLLMALKLDPVRLLIADDVGIGKTIEAGMIARELLDRGEIEGMAVICPPHLCEQWQHELAEKFHIEAEVVRPGTVPRLERTLGANESIFTRYPFTVVSIDYVKSATHRDLFVKDCPTFVILDEAHTSASGTGNQQQRYALLRRLVDPATEAGRTRHLVMTTATPHSGVEQAFRSLLVLLDPVFAGLPDDPSDIRADDPLRLRLANHLVQRRRGDIKKYLEDTTTFPTREVRERPYRMSAEANAFFEHARLYAQEMVQRAATESEVRQRVSWWAALALLQSVTSSPAAAAKALRTKSSLLTIAAGREDGSAATVRDELDLVRRIGIRTMDEDVVDTDEVNDVVTGVDLDPAPEDDDSTGKPASAERRRLLALAKEADALAGEKDAKLKALVGQLRELLDDGFRPIVYCRYIETAMYLKEQLSSRLRGVEVDAVTGLIPAEARVERVEALSAHPRRVLVATDCLSEGINLQQHYDSVIHYDLAWNPTRHEQREGRVDRFGQAAPIVRTIMLYGEDNPIDLAVMRVLLRKAEKIRQSLGVSISVPQGTGAVMNAIFDAIFHGKGDARQLSLDLSAGNAERQLSLVEQALDLEWRRIEERAGRTIFQQASMNPNDVKRELDETVRALGNHVDVERLMRTAVSRFNARIGVGQKGAAMLPLAVFPPRIRDAFGGEVDLPIAFELPVADGVRYCSRTDPLVEALATYLVDGALDPHLTSPASRASVIRTDAVSARTTVALLRLRIHLRTPVRGQRAAKALLAEDVLLVGWRGDPESPLWLSDDDLAPVLNARATTNLPEAFQADHLAMAVEDYTAMEGEFARIARERAAEVRSAHRRVRDVLDVAAGQLTADPAFPIDALGLYVFLPAVR